MQAVVVLRRTFIVFFLFVTSAFAQEYPGEFHRFNFSAGAGVSFPTSNAGSNFKTGWNMDFRGGFNVSRNFQADLDFSYNHWGLTNAALADFGQPGGFADVWSLSFAPVVRVAPNARVDPYLIFGAGVYHRGLSLTQPATLQTIFCDPFFGYCYPALVGVDQVVASFSSYKPGFNAGGGLEFRLSGPMKLFAEARYNEMFTTRGPNLSYVPLTFGLRW
jgi:opacity protein-like surface antigen